MPQSSIFRWREGGGWLVLAGGGQNPDIDTQMLYRTIAHNPIAYLWADLEKGEAYLNYIQELGGRTGFLLDALHEEASSVQTQLADAGIIILGDDGNVEQLQGALRGRVRQGIEEAFQEGATIYAIGRMAAIFAEWLPAPIAGLQAGLGWLENAILTAPFQDDQTLTTLLNDYMPAAFGLGIGEQAALAFGPSGQLEIWGEKDITVILGQQFKRE